MKYSIRKVFIVICLVLSLAGTAKAFVPLVIPAWVLASTAVLSVATAVGLHYGLKPTSPSSVASDGSLSRPAALIYASAKLLAIIQKNITARMAFDKAQQLSNKLNPDGTDMYPLTKSAMYGPKTLPPIDVNNKVGDLVSTPIGNKKITAVGFLNSGAGCSHMVVEGNICYIPIPLSPSVSCGGSNYLCNGQKTFTLAAPGVLPIVLKTGSQYAATVSSDGVSGAVKPEYQAELDKMYQDSDYVPTFTDDTTGLPLAPPLVGDVMSPSQLDAYNRTGAATAAAAAAAASTSAAASSAGTAATAAAAAATAAHSAAVANPADPALAQKDKDAAAAAAAAAATAAAAQAAADQVNADQLKDDADTADNVESKPDIKKIDWSAFKRITFAAGSVFPFSMLNNVSGYLTPFLGGDPEAPKFDLPLFGGVIHVDLSVFDPVASVLRFIIVGFFTIGMIIYIVRFYRGVA